MGRVKKSIKNKEEGKNVFLFLPKPKKGAMKKTPRTFLYVLYISINKKVDPIEVIVATREMVGLPELNNERRQSSKKWKQKFRIVLNQLERVNNYKTARDTKNVNRLKTKRGICFHDDIHVLKHSHYQRGTKKQKFGTGLSTHKIVREHSVCSICPARKKTEDLMNEHSEDISIEMVIPCKVPCCKDAMRYFHDHENRAIRDLKIAIGECNLCGIDVDPDFTCAYDFEPPIKLFDIMEIRKCQLLCANCQDLWVT